MRYKTGFVLLLSSFCKENPVLVHLIKLWHSNKSMKQVKKYNFWIFLLFNISIIEECCLLFLIPITLVYKKTGEDDKKGKNKLCTYYGTIE